MDASIPVQKSTIKKLTCIVCPRGCALSVTQASNGSIQSIEGFSCPRGKTYAQAEVTNPVRMLCSSVALYGSRYARVLPVKTQTSIPKDSVLKAVQELAQVKMNIPVHTGDVVYKDIAHTGINVIATKTFLK